MRTFEKQYIGKGTKVADLEIVSVVLKMEDAEEHIFEMEGNRYLKFEIAQLREADKFNRTHTCYVSKLVDQVNEGDMATPPQETPEKPSKPAKRSRKPKKAAEQYDSVEDLPF